MKQKSALCVINQIYKKRNNETNNYLINHFAIVFNGQSRHKASGYVFGQYVNATKHAG